MKIAIFGYPRSGTTMLYKIIAQHLLAAGVLEPWASIGEVFNPVDGARLLVSSQSGHLVNHHDVNLSDEQSREERLQLFKKHSADNYIIKMMPHDLKAHGLVEAVMEAKYNIIAIERRNPLSAFLSSIIAYQHQVWHIYDQNKIPEYEPFVVSDEHIVALGKSFAIYHHTRDQLNPSSILYYEDIVQQPIVATLVRAGVYQEGVVVKESPTKKIHSFEDKAKLIINLEEVIDYLTGILVAYDITMEHNSL